MARHNLILISFLSLLLLNSSTNASAQEDTAQLRAMILKMDSILFNAFNTRDITTLKSFFHDDLEFYHDKTGLTNYVDNMKAFETNMSNAGDLSRSLIDGSSFIYPIKDYGAIQEGRHRFCHTENGKPDCGTFKFIHIWKKINDTWKITRVISYDH